MLENILYASPVGISYFENGKIKWANQAMVEMFGFKRQEDYLGKGPREFYATDEEYNRVRQLFYANLSEGQLAQADSIFQRRDGSTFAGHIRISALDATSPRKGTIATIIDVSARKKAEEALRESEERHRILYRESTRAQELYRSLLNSCADAIVIYDMEGHAKYISEAFTQIFGWDEEEILNKRIPYVPDSEREVTMTQIQNVITGATGRGSFETKRFTKDGRLLDIRISASRYHDQEGKPAGLLAILSDITERKKAELALAQSEQQLRLLSAQLLTAQENERKRLAQELHDGIGQSLTAIKFRVENCIQLTSESGDTTHLESVRAIVPAIQDAVEEVRRISMDLRPSILDDLGILATITWFCREFQATFSGISITKKISVREGEIPGHLKIVLFRILQEALNNVAKHSRADSVRLYLRKRNRNLELVITDNGVGIDRTARLAAEVGKTGFGLASLRERTEQSGGVFVLQVRKGMGTGIRCSWPMP
jgi:PAS domain S-box-containing protein